jgi:hypothetical protein
MSAALSESEKKVSGSQTIMQRAEGAYGLEPPGFRDIASTWIRKIIFRPGGFNLLGRLQKCKPDCNGHRIRISGLLLDE